MESSNSVANNNSLTLPLVGNSNKITTTNEATTTTNVNNNTPNLRLLADTQSTNSINQPPPPPPHFFTSSRWSADGTSIFTTSSNHSISIFVLPSDLLSLNHHQPHHLTPHSTLKLPESTPVFAPSPYFSLSEPQSQTFLAASRDHPIHLYHAFPAAGTGTANAPPPPLCGYKLIRKETEEYITPSSLIWDYPGSHFICGSVNRIDMFDLSCPGSDGPVLTIPTIPSRRHISKGSGVGMKGTVSALSLSSDSSGNSSILAAGTWTRWVGLYDIHRTDKTVANWSIASATTTTTTDSSSSSSDIGGQGISQTIWSPCGRYLILNERNSSGLLVYDVRVTGQLLSILTGRQATTQQRLSCDVFPGDSSSSGGGFEVWAGSQDGRIGVWEGVGLHSEYGAGPSWSWKGHGSPVGSTTLHSGGSVVASCSGGWEHARGYEEGGKGEGRGCSVLEESSLKVWDISSMGGGGGEEDTSQAS